MSDGQGLPGGKHLTRRLILPALIISRFAMVLPGILTGLLLIDIGLTFGRSVVVMGQIRTASSIVGVVSAFLMGALTVRYKHKSLLMMGLLFIGISALGCSFASNFNVMLISYAISGLGLVMVDPMTSAIVAEWLPIEKRKNAIGWLVAGMSLSYVVGAPVIGLITGLSGWRLAFLGYTLPVSLLGLFLSLIGLPSTSVSQKSAMSRENYLEGFKGIFSNRSAIACLLGNALLVAAYEAIVLYGSSFFRQRFLISREEASIIVLGGALCFTLGGLVSGQFINRFGRKPLVAITGIIAGILIISYTNLPNLWLSLAVRCLASVFASMLFTAATIITLEQVPRFRGTMMSISSAAVNLGSALGAGIGGLALFLYDYEFVGVSLGPMMVIASVIYHLLVNDPAGT